MVWLDLEAGIVEEFASAHSRYVNATARIAEALADRGERRALSRSLWRVRNPEKNRDANRRSARAHYARLVVDPVRLARRREAVRAAVARYYAKNAEKVRSYNRARYAARKVSA